MWGFDFRRWLGSDHESQFKTDEKPIKKLSLAFDEAPFTYKSNIEYLKAMPQAIESLEAFLGLSTLNDRDERKSPEFADESVDSTDSFDSQEEEIDENRYIGAYWRCDEGSGSIIKDYSGRDRNLQADTILWDANPCQDGEPLDYEDKWGKSNSPSFPITML